MKDNSNWTLRFNRSSKEAFGYDLKPSDFKQEHEYRFYVAGVVFIAGILAVLLL